MIDFVRRHPFTTVLITAIALRAIAVIFSKGYMASDDQFETIDVAFNWLLHGFCADDGTLTWGFTSPRDIARFPLYAFSLWCVMKACTFVGITNLDGMMYAVRAVHALLSLAGVWGVYRIVRLVTESNRWAFWAGMFMAAHAALPFLSVRSLIEMVSGNIWIVALLCLYLYDREKRIPWLVWSGILAGLAWMIRFEIVFAIVSVPFVLWYTNKRLRPALSFTLPLVGMLLLSGLTDFWLMDSFAASTVNHLRQIAQEGVVYATPVFIYPAVLLMFFFPPVSFVAFALSLRKRFLKEHTILFIGNVVFVLIHTLSPSRQERYMIPIIPALTVMLILSLWCYYRSPNAIRLVRKWQFAVWLPIVLLNSIILIPFTLNYSHRGLVEPLVHISNTSSGATVLFVSPERGQIYPYHYGYADFEPIGRQYVNRWSDLDTNGNLAKWRETVDYIILYPPKQSDLARYRDSLEILFPNITLEKHITGSTVDASLHWLNPKHNPTHEAWLYTTRE